MMRDHKLIAAVDARTLVPVSDDAGGVVVYVGGRAAYYVMNGEWFAALPEPSDAISQASPPATTDGAGGSDSSALDSDQLVSTS